MEIGCWLVAGAVIAAGVAAVWRWRRRKFPRPGWLFSLWAPTVYALILLAGWAAGWAASALLQGLDPGALAAQRGLFTLLLLTAFALLPIAGLTVVFRWALNSDITDVPD